MANIAPRCVLLRLRPDRVDRGRAGAADDHRGDGRDRAARQHADPVRRVHPRPARSSRSSAGVRALYGRAMAIVLCAGYITAVASVVGISGGWTSDILGTTSHQHSLADRFLVLMALALAMIVRGSQGLDQGRRGLLRLRAGLMVIIASPAHQEQRLDQPPSVRPGPPVRRVLGPLTRLPTRDLHVHRLGELRSARRGERGPTRRHRQGDLVVGPAARRHLHPVRLHDRDLVRREHRHAGQADRAVRLRRPLGLQRARLPRLHRGLHLDLRDAPVGVQLAGADHLQLRPRGPAAVVGGTVTKQSHTPYVAFIVYFASRSGWLHLRVAQPPVLFFGEIGTMGTILVAVTYLVANLALPVYFRRHHADLFHPSSTCCCRCSARSRSGIRSTSSSSPDSPSRSPSTRWWRWA